VRPGYIHGHLIQNREHGLFHVIPSFLIVNAGDETLADVAKRLLVRGTAAKEDWGRPMAYTRQFWSNFFARAGAEIRDTYNSMLAEARSKGEEPSDFLKMTELRYGHIPDFKDAKIPSWTEASMTSELLDEWWRIVSPRAFQVQALVALKTMWEGAAKVLSDEAKANVVLWDSVLQFVEGYGLSLSKFSGAPSETELARLLVAEFVAWHRNLGEKGVIPRAFTGVTATGRQAILVLTGLPLDHIQRRQFLIWLCRKEEFIGYAYSTEVGTYGQDGAIIEALDIYASSARLDVSKTLLIRRGGDEKISFLDQHDAALPPKYDNGLFFGLERSIEAIPSQNEELFANLWQELKQKAMWRQR
jgi:hypothetical protein